MGDSLLDAAVQNGELVSDSATRSVAQPAAGAAFPRTARLLKHSDFERVYKQGRRHFSTNMTVFYLPRDRAHSNSSSDAVSPDGALPENGARVGFTVGRVLGGAVQRNRIKRRLREAVRMRRVALQGQAPVDIVINPKKSVLTMEFSVLLDEVGRALDAVAKKMAVRTK